ncbi:MAG: sigma 54-interacting transcriptional regulator [Proteobacteria bacterium]|nr:sigma 54-interacting transcriptional regulator [Pseudomonadota bacterium]RTL24142.1 MAG: sigma-54-dependent Fis family transcriptional regulator [Rhodocyclaceae bacterium]
MSKSCSPQYPSDADLLSQVRFDPAHGKVWFNEQRMLLFHASGMSLLRKELIETLGLERASGLLMRFGFHAGFKDAALARKLRPEITTADAFLVGPQLACIKGLVQVEPLELSFDLSTGAFIGRFEWTESYEAEAHQQQFGLAAEPVCWTLIGYSSGFTSYYMGRKILFKEETCAGCGAAHCRIIGKPAEEWGDRAELEKFYEPDSVAEELLALRTQVSELQETVRAARSSPTDSVSFIGRSAGFLKAKNLIERGAKSRASVLLLGETGVGKEVFARSLHALSDRSAQPFVAVNCASIPSDLIASELFGVERGAFTGANVSREGKFERADGGTIFLDEVVELTPGAQAALLRVLQEGELERVGGTFVRKIDVRVVAATNEDLQEAVKKGKFRADLFYRLNVYPVSIPPLRERAEDIPLLARHFLGKFHALYKKTTLGISDRALRALKNYGWPGNIRELENMIERGVILTDHNRSIDIDSLFASPPDEDAGHTLVSQTGALKLDSERPPARSPYDELSVRLLNEGFSISDFESAITRNAMALANDNVTQAARLIGMTRAQLAYRLEKIKGE